MFNRRYTNEEIPVDLLRAIINKSRKYSLVILVNGHGQVGKTTFIWHLANRIMQIKRFGLLNPNDRRITWKEWDSYNLTATNAREFVKIWNSNYDAVLTLAEASETLNYLDWFSVMSRVFNSTTTTQGLKHNICFLDTCYAFEIMKHARDKVDYRIDVHGRNDYERTAYVRSGWINIDFLRDRWKLMPFNQWDCQYSMKELLLSKNYTDMIAETLKADTAIKNEQLVGERPYKPSYNPTKPITERNMPDWVRELL